MGNIYLGKVINGVSFGMQAAFVDIGEEKNAFLYVDDASLPPEMQEEKESKPKGKSRKTIKKLAETWAEHNGSGYKRRL